MSCVFSNNFYGCFVLVQRFVYYNFSRTLTRPPAMFSNQQQQNASNLLHQSVTSSGTILLAPPPAAISINSVVTNCNNNADTTSVATTILAVSIVWYYSPNLDRPWVLHVKYIVERISIMVVYVQCFGTFTNKMYSVMFTIHPNKWIC